MDRLFLDANVLFSAAYSLQSPLLRLWRMDVELMTSEYAVTEAKRNLGAAGEQDRLLGLLRQVRIVPESTVELGHLASLLPSKDRPILAAAVAANASYLVTGDHRHFGPLFGKLVSGVRVVTPGRFAAEAERPRPS